MGYYMKSNENMERNFNVSDHKKDTYKNREIIAFQNITDIQNMSGIQKMPASENKRPPSPDQDKTIHSKVQNRPQFISYKTEEQLIADPCFGKYVEEYNSPTFYRILGILEKKYQFMIQIHDINKQNLESEK